MIAQTTDLIEKGRLNDPENNDCRGVPFGAFVLSGPERHGPCLKVVVAGADEEAWRAWQFPLPMFEHVSVSVLGEQRCPTWEEMCHIKDLFWLPEECVVQYHPPKSRYVNHHNYVLHMWRPVGVDIPQPPLLCV